MLRKLKWGLLAVVVAVIVVVVVSRRDEKRQARGAEDTVTAPVTGMPRQLTPVQSPPAACTALADGGFSCGACRDDSDCPAGEGCFISMTSGRTECQGSECTKNEDCPSKMLCRVVARTLRRHDPMRGCVNPGVRDIGAPCEPDNAGDPSVSCGAALLCVNGGCAPSCVENEFPERNACVGEVPCVKTDNGWGCMPSCKREPKECRDGKVCEYLSVEDPSALCIHRVGRNCLGPKGGCPYDHDCIVETNARAERTTFSCVPRCTPGSSEKPCPADAVCIAAGKAAHCRRRCAPEKNAGCGDGERCMRADATSELWYCSAA